LFQNARLARLNRSGLQQKQVSHRLSQIESLRDTLARSAISLKHFIGEMGVLCASQEKRCALFIFGMPEIRETTFGDRSALH
jgi:hypothetical protein